MTTDKRNSIWLAIQFFSTIIVSFITLKLNLTHYGEELFGAWILISSLWGFSAVLDFGMGTSIVRFVARLKDEEDNKINILLSSTFIIYIILGFLIFFLMYGIAESFYFSNNNVVPLKFYSILRVSFFFLGIGFYVRYISLFFKSFVEGMSDFVLSSKILIMGNIILLAGVIIITIFHLSLIVLALVYILFSIVLLSSFWFFFQRRYKKYFISWKNFNIVEIKKIFLFSISVQGMSIFGSFIDPLIKYILGNFYALNTVSFYEIARRFASAISGLFNTTFRTILPKASKLHSDVEYKNFIMKDCVNLSQLGATYSVVIFGVGSIFLSSLIKIWFHFDQAVIIYLILSLPESLNNFGYSIYNFLIGIGKASILMKIQMLNLATISATLISGYYILGAQLGLLGYFLSILAAIVIMLISIKKITHISIRLFLLKSKFIKLIYFDLFLLISVIIINYKLLNIFIVLTLLSFISFFIYFKEIIKYSKNLRISFVK